MPKPQDIFQLARQEAVRVTASPQAWQSFLYTAAHNYHTTYLNQLDSRPAARRRGLRQHGILEYEGKPAGHARQQMHHRAAAPTGRGGDKACFCHRRYHTIEPDAHWRAVGGHGHNVTAASAR